VTLQPGSLHSLCSLQPVRLPEQPHSTRLVCVKRIMAHPSVIVSIRCSSPPFSVYLEHPPPPTPLLAPASHSPLFIEDPRGYDTLPRAAWPSAGTCDSRKVYRWRQRPLTSTTWRDRDGYTQANPRPQLKRGSSTGPHDAGSCPSPLEPGVRPDDWQRWSDVAVSILGGLDHEGV